MEIFGQSHMGTPGEILGMILSGIHGHLMARIVIFGDHHGDGITGPTILGVGVEDSMAHIGARPSEGIITDMFT